MALLTKSFLHQKMQKKSGLTEAVNIRNFSARELLLEKRAADLQHRTYDIFLSHSFEDAIYIQGLRDELVAVGLTVYVDWLDDPQLDRASVTKATAAVLRQRMRSCRCLLYATSTAARRSVWMPWELGYMDSHTKSRVAIVPIVDDNQAQQEFKGQEYLGLYPYFDKTGSIFYIHASSQAYVLFNSWLAGSNP